MTKSDQLLNKQTTFEPGRQRLQIWFLVILVSAAALRMQSLSKKVTSSSYVSRTAEYSSSVAMASAFIITIVVFSMGTNCAYPDQSPMRWSATRRAALPLRLGLSNPAAECDGQKLLKNDVEIRWSRRVSSDPPGLFDTITLHSFANLAYRFSAVAGFPR